MSLVAVKGKHRAPRAWLYLAATRPGNALWAVRLKGALGSVGWAAMLGSHAVMLPGRSALETATADHLCPLAGCGNLLVSDAAIVDQACINLALKCQREIKINVQK